MFKLHPRYRWNSPYSIQRHFIRMRQLLYVGNKVLFKNTWVLRQFIDRSKIWNGQWDIRIAIWTRFAGGGATTLATSPPQTYRCGTLATGWVVSALPSTVGATTTVVVCFNWGYNICYWITTLSVTNCNGFYVFLMNNVPSCTSRYCTE